MKVSVPKLKTTNWIARGPFKPKRRKVVRSGGIPPNPQHLDFIRTRKCVLAEDPRHKCSGIMEAAHLGSRGRSQKAADETAVPMCSGAHRTGMKAFHKGEKTFFEYWVVPAKEYLIGKFSRWGETEGTITEDNLWLKQQNSRVI